jgi:hypothetical protein
MLSRTAKSCGPDAPALASSWRNFASPTGQTKSYPQATVTISRSPGRARRKPLKPSCVGMPGQPGKPAVTTLVCFLHFAHEAAGAPGTRHSPRPLFSLGGSFTHSSGGFRRGDGGAVSLRHCEERSDEAIHSFFARPFLARRHGLLRCARNDGFKLSLLFDISRTEPTTSSSLRSQGRPQRPTASFAARRVRRLWRGRPPRPLRPLRASAGSPPPARDD